MPNNPNLGRFCNVDAHFGVKDSVILPTYAVRKAMDVGWVMMDKLNKAMFLFINTEGGKDRKHRFDLSQLSCLWIVRKYNLQKIMRAKVSFLPKFIIPNIKS